MHRFGSLPFYRMLFSPEGEGSGGGGADAGAADKGAGGDGKGDAGGKGGDLNLDAANDAGSLFAALPDTATDEEKEAAKAADAAAKAEKGKGAADAPYVPEGLPDHLKGKTNKETIDALAKAYAGARAELSKKGGGKPPAKAEEYFTDLTLPEGIVLGPAAKTVADDPAIKTLAAVAHKHGLTKAQFDGVVSDFLIGVKEAGLIGEGFNAEREMAVLGGAGKAKPIIAGIRAWGEGLKSQGILSAEEFAEFQIMAGTGLGLVVMNKLRAMSGEQAIPVDVGANDGDQSDDELYAMVRDPRYTTDPAFEARVTKAFQKRFGSGASNGSAPVAGTVGAR